MHCLDVFYCPPFYSDVAQYTIIGRHSSLSNKNSGHKVCLVIAGEYQECVLRGSKLAKYCACQRSPTRRLHGVIKNTSSRLLP